MTESDWEANVEDEIAELGPLEKTNKKGAGKKSARTKGISQDTPTSRAPSKRSAPGSSAPKQPMASSSNVRPKKRPPPVSSEDAPLTRSQKLEEVDMFDLRASRR